jgi:hypothetical protein
VSAATGTGGRAGPPDLVAITAADKAVMRARLAMLAEPRAGDSAAVAALRRVLRDPVLMARVMTTVESWPVLDDDQCATVAALFRPAPGGRSARR